MNNQPLTNEAGEVRELTTSDFEKFKPATQVLPLLLRQKLNLEPAEKFSAMIEVDDDVLEAFRKIGVRNSSF